MSRLIVRSLLAASLFVARSAHASELEDLIEQGVAERKAGHDEAALELFRRADALQSTGRTRAQIALAEQALGLWVAADTDLSRALAPPLDPWVVKNMKALEGSREAIRKHLGTLEVRGEPRGAEIAIDGRPVGLIPTDEALHVEVGRHLLRVTLAGHHPVERNVQIEPNQLSRESITLPRLDPMATEAPRPVVVAPAPASTKKPVSGVPKALGWGLVGASGATLALGVVSLIVSRGYASSFDDAPLCTGYADQPSVCNDRAASARTFQSIAIGGFAASGAFAISGSLCLWLSPNADGQTTVGVRGAL